MKFKKIILIGLLFGISAQAQFEPRYFQGQGIYNTSTGATFLAPVTTPIANRACVFDSSGILDVSVTTLAELANVSGTTSPIQTQINLKANSNAISAVGFSGQYSDLVGIPANVSSFNSRTGAVVPQLSDYSSFFDSIGSASTAQSNAESFTTAAFGTTTTMPNLSLPYSQLTGTPTPGGTVEWGSIIGTLSSQTDLQSALNAKQNSLGYTPENVANKSTSIATDQGSDIKYPSVKSVYDWATGLFQPIGSYITSLNNDVVASGPGAASAVIAQTATDRYVDLIGGNDSNSGASLHRWKTMQHACTVVAGLTTFNEPYTIHISGGTGNDTDSGTVTCPTNVAYVADQDTQLTGNYVFSTGVNDFITITNLIFLGSVSWLRNDIYSLTLNVNNSVFGGGLNFKQSGSGTASIQAMNTTFVGMDVLLPTFGSFFSGCNFTAPATFEDTNSSAYYQFESGYIGTPISFAGGPYIYMSGVIADVPYGYTLTTSTTGNGTPTIQTDSGSVPPTISGPNNLYLASFAQHESYTPAMSGNWSPPPSQVAAALDQLAARPTGSGAVVNYGSIGSPITITASGGYTSTTDANSEVYTVSAGGAVSLTANPQITAGTTVGQILTLTGTSDTNYIILSDGNGLWMNGPIMLKQNVSISYRWNGSVWRESYRNN